MNRADFIDVLRDYLKQYFKASEIEEMIWDYEEYFDAGLASGKTEAEIIISLGSPKKIAKDLAEELSMKDAKSKSIDGGTADKFVNTAKLYALKGKSFLKNSYFRAKEKTTEYLTEDNKGTINGIGKFLLKALFIIIIAVIAFYLGIMLVVAIPSVLGLIVGILVAFSLSILFIPLNLPTASAFFFGGLILLGFTMIIFELARALIRFIRQSYQRLKTWWKYRLNGGANHE